MGLQERLGGLIARHGVPGASVSVLNGGEVTDAVAGVLDARTGDPVRPESPFMIQSVTKVWTATLVLQLVDEGLVGLEEPVVQYLPGFRTADPEVSAGVTVRHLLTHTGGFEGDLWAATTDGPDALERFVADLVPQAAQLARPGELFSYCSAGMGVLARIVELARGTTYDTVLRRHLADPLGAGRLVSEPGPGVAIGHVGDPPRPLATWAVMPASNPAAGNRLAMPAHALIRLAALHLADGDGLLSPASARLMRTPFVGQPARRGRMRQGLGWMLVGDRVVQHDGGAPGCGALLRLVPDRGVAVAVLANGGDVTGLFTELCDELLSDLADLPPTPPVVVPTVRAVADADRYVGRYELRNVVAEVTRDRDALRLTQHERGDAVAMAVLAGTDLAAETVELRPLEGETFVRVAADGRAVGTVEFLGADARGRARFLHTGRAAPRSD